MATTTYVNKETVLAKHFSTETYGPMEDVWKRALAWMAKQKPLLFMSDPRFVNMTWTPDNTKEMDKPIGFFVVRHGLTRRTEGPVESKTHVLGPLTPVKEWMLMMYVTTDGPARVPKEVQALYKAYAVAWEMTDGSSEREERGEGKSAADHVVAMRMGRTIRVSSDYRSSEVVVMELPHPDWERYNQYIVSQTHVPVVSSIVPPPAVVAVPATKAPVVPSTVVPLPAGIASTTTKTKKKPRVSSTSVRRSSRLMKRLS